MLRTFDVNYILRAIKILKRKFTSITYFKILKLDEHSSKV